ncbi:MAG TPA: serine/threonine-protein kinase [Gemmataceae bacterium]|jgi:serine/threonine-protein kinase
MDKTNLDPSQPLPDMPGDLLHELRGLGDYRILRRLGEGGMGAVYLAYREDKDQQVAIKVLGDHLASNQGYVDRFYREAKSGALLSHPNIVRTLSVGQDQATALHYLVLEFVDGQSAQALLDKQSRLALGDAVHIALDVARALEHAHSRNIVHRDIKPDNILITRSGVSKLVDLGLARRTDEASHLTAARQGFGTTYYMPYEQAINARHADGRSDIYALGATLYHLVTGSVPFPGDNHLEVVEKKNQGVFTPASKLNAAVPPVLDHILARMLARQPRDRYQTASELIVDLERSRLAAPVPTFADPNQALQDPWVQQCLASSAEPTRLDPEMPPIPPPPVPEPEPKADGVWVLRYRNPAGKICRARATTEQIAVRLRRGRLSLKVEARHAASKDYHPLSFFPEFKHIPPPPRAPRKQPQRNGDVRRDATPPEPVVEPRSRRLLFLLGAAAGLLLLAVLLTLLHFLHAS